MLLWKQSFLRFLGKLNMPNQLYITITLYSDTTVFIGSARADTVKSLYKVMVMYNWLGKEVYQEILEKKVFRKAYHCKNIRCQYVLGRGTRQHAFKLCVPVGMVCAAKAILLDQWLVAVLSNLWTQLQHDVQDWYRCGVAIKICQVSPSDCWQLWSSSGHGIGDLASGIPDREDWWQRVGTFDFWYCCC